MVCYMIHSHHHPIQHYDLRHVVKLQIQRQKLKIHEEEKEEEEEEARIGIFFLLCWFT